MQAEIDRRSLYEEVWKEPVRIVAPRYGLSDVGLAKLCRRLAIPLPSRGYWAKVAAGKIMGRPALPPTPEGGNRGFWIPRKLSGQEEAQRKDREAQRHALRARLEQQERPLAVQLFRRMTGQPVGSRRSSAPTRLWQSRPLPVRAHR
jgi:hypothetical protein